jgi:putative addiction module component (TIGR02574 family)
MELTYTDVLINFALAAGKLVTHQEMLMTTLQEIIDAARTLSPAERLRLVDAVWDDEHPKNWPALSPEWLAEVQRRSAEFDAGRMKASSWEDVQARVRRKAGLNG